MGVRQGSFGVNWADLQAVASQLSADALEHATAMMDKVDYYKVHAEQAKNEFQSLAFSHKKHGAMRQLENFVARELGKKPPVTNYAPLGEN
jgi:hypothetical protein